MPSKKLLRYLLVGLLAYWASWQGHASPGCLGLWTGASCRHHGRRPPAWISQTPAFSCSITPSVCAVERLPCRDSKAYGSPLHLRRPCLNVVGGLWTQRRLAAVNRLASAPNIAAADQGMWAEYECPLLSQIDRFVLFADLHVSDATLHTCLDALALVQRTCKGHSNISVNGPAELKHSVGVGGESTPIPQPSPAAAVFLGDFWHSRVERQLHWGLLRPLLEFWEQWDVPVSPVTARATVAQD